MKKKKILVFAALYLIFLSFAAGGYLFYRKQIAPKNMDEWIHKEFSPVVRIEQDDDLHMNFEGLMRGAAVIALVTPVDDVSEERTRLIHPSGLTGSHVYSLRTVRVLKYFKNEGNWNETFTMAELCGLAKIKESDERPSLILLGNNFPMALGNTYLVFLQATSLYVYPMTLDNTNSTFHLDILKLNVELDICIQSLYQLGLLTGAATESPAKEALDAFCQSKRFLRSSSEQAVPYLALDGWESISIDTEYTALFMEATLWYLETETGYLFRLGELLYEYEE